MRLVGERRACAAGALAFFTLLFLLNGLSGPPALAPLFLALGAAYLVGFVGIVALWFWARWYVLGLTFSGLVMAAMLAWQIGLDPVVVIWGGGHGAAALALVGRGPASAYDGRRDWRERWRMDDNAANRLGKAIMRAGASLPYLIMAGLAPKQGLGAILGIFALGLAAAGLVGLVRVRTWGVVALIGAALAAVGTAVTSTGWLIEGACPCRAGVFGAAPIVALAALAGTALLGAAVVPFARPLFIALRADPPVRPVC